jgi:DNA invertase Pin-like site-specific DNA recombinase
MAGKGKRVEAAGYLRTSSTTNVGDGKDSEARQRKAIESYAKAAGIVIVDWFYDAAVSGADPIEARPGFAALLARIAGNGVRTIIVETANRFARDLMVQEVGFAMLRDLGVTLIAADSPSSFLDNGPTSKLIRQILGAVSEFDKAMIVAKLKGARERARRARGKCEGRKAYAEREGGQELVAAARQLRTNPRGRPHSLNHPARSWGPRQQKGDHPAECRGPSYPLLEVGGPGVDSRHHSARLIVADDGHQAVRLVGSPGSPPSTR